MSSRVGFRVLFMFIGGFYGKIRIGIGREREV